MKNYISLVIVIALTLSQVQSKLGSILYNIKYNASSSPSVNKRRLNNIKSSDFEVRLDNEIGRAMPDNLTVYSVKANPIPRLLDLKQTGTRRQLGRHVPVGKFKRIIEDDTTGVKQKDQYKNKHFSKKSGKVRKLNISPSDFEVRLNNEVVRAQSDDLTVYNITTDPIPGIRLQKGKGKVEKMAKIVHEADVDGKAAKDKYKNRHFVVKGSSFLKYLRFLEPAFVDVSNNDAERAMPDNSTVYKSEKQSHRPSEERKLGKRETLFATSVNKIQKSINNDL